MAFAAGGIGLLAAVVLAVAWHISIQNRENRAALELAEAQNLHLREMQLAGAGLAHEMKNPLNVVRGTAQGMLQRAERVDSERQALECILDEIDRIVSRLNGFLSFSRVPKPDWSAFSARDVVEEVATLLGHGAENGELEIRVDDLPIIRADRALFRQVIFNLLHNAVRATEDGGSICVRAARNGRSHVTVEVVDTGMGVPEDLRNGLFRPYCSGWPEGTGLGLSIVRQIALVHGWEVGYRPNSEKGTIFWVSDIEIEETADESAAGPEANPDC